MASVLVTFRILPESPEVDLDAMEADCLKMVQNFGALSTKVERAPFAFGLVALNIMFVLNEAKGDTEPLEDLLRNADGVQSVEVTDVRRTFG